VASGPVPGPQAFPRAIPLAVERNRERKTKISSGMLLRRMQIPRDVDDCNPGIFLKIKNGLEQLRAVIVQQEVVPVVLNQFGNKDCDMVVSQPAPLARIPQSA
jgi:hypothetical protein